MNAKDGIEEDGVEDDDDDDDDEDDDAGGPVDLRRHSYGNAYVWVMCACVCVVGADASVWCVVGTAGRLRRLSTGHRGTSMATRALCLCVCVCAGVGFLGFLWCGVAECFVPQRGPGVRRLAGCAPSEWCWNGEARKEVWDAREEAVQHQCQQSDGRVAHHVADNNVARGAVACARVGL